jgi:hypothetical protein
MVEKTHNYYVHILEPKLLLKSILSSSKKVITSSQSYYKTLEIRREKSELFSKLRKEVVELLELSKNLEQTLPYKELISSTKKRPKNNSTSKPKTISKKTVNPNSKNLSKEKSSEGEKKLSKEEKESAKLAELLSSIEKKLDAFD